MRAAIRVFLKNPGFALLAVVTIAAGVAINAGDFAFAGEALLRSASDPASGRIMMLLRSTPKVPDGDISAADFGDLQREATAFETLACCEGRRPILEDPQQPAVNLSALAVSGAFFRTYSVRPLLGRVIDEQDEGKGRGRVLVLSEQLWRLRFNADPGIVGRILEVDGAPATAIGVMPASFAFPMVWVKVDAWQPLAMDAQDWSKRDDAGLQVIGRLRPNVTREQAQAEADTIAGRAHGGSGIAVPSAVFAPGDAQQLFAEA